ncbi:hypothetical protein ACMDCR_27355 [Labrys okinawensis]|uniref:hypothetical protein n=1 Tax=Labrys okinawensis TaxID=346911 RepID=UPI0039BD87B9
MNVALTGSALDELQRQIEPLREIIPGRLIPCLGWHLSTGELQEDGSYRQVSGPGFGVGVFRADDDYGGWQRMEQDGVEFLLLLPPDIDAEKAATIDFRDGIFIFV